MNKRIKLLAEQATDTVEIVNPDTGITHHREFFDKEKFAELIVKECDRLNRKQSLELEGVIADVEQDSFDDVCLDTVKQVANYLACNSLKKHFEE